MAYGDAEMWFQFPSHQNALGSLPFSSTFLSPPGFAKINLLLNESHGGGVRRDFAVCNASNHKLIEQTDFCIK